MDRGAERRGMIVRVGKSAIRNSQSEIGNPQSRGLVGEPSEPSVSLSYASFLQYVSKASTRFCAIIWGLRPSM
jgi:hypothetical protein